MALDAVIKPHQLIASDRVEGTAVRRPNGDMIGHIELRHPALLARLLKSVFLPPDVDHDHRRSVGEHVKAQSLVPDDAPWVSATKDQLKGMPEFSPGPAPAAASGR